MTGTRIIKIVESSKARKDVLHDEMNTLSEEGSLNLVYHTNCVSTYTSKHHIERFLKRQGEKSKNETEQPVEKRLRRSNVPKFNWKTDCFFCGKICNLTKDPKNPSRFRKAYESRTSTRPNLSSFKESVLKVIVWVFAEYNIKFKTKNWITFCLFFFWAPAERLGLMV